MVGVTFVALSSKVNQPVMIPFLVFVATTLGSANFRCILEKVAQIFDMLACSLEADSKLPPWYAWATVLTMQMFSLLSESGWPGTFGASMPKSSPFQALKMS